MPTPIRFRELRASTDSSCFATSEDNESVSIWSSKSLKKEVTVKPGFTGGAERLAIDAKRSRIYSGTWEHGLTCYDYTGKRVVWHRKDLIGIQMVEVSEGFPDVIYVSMEEPDYLVGAAGTFLGVVAIDVETGKTVWRRSGWYQAHVHPRKPFVMLEHRKGIEFLDKDRQSVGTASMTHFALIGVAFGDSYVALGEGSKGFRILDFKGSILASYLPEGREPYCGTIGVNQKAGTVICKDSWNGTFMTVLDLRSGKVSHEYRRESGAEVCFINDGSLFVDATGKVCASSDGSQITELKS